MDGVRIAHDFSVLFLIKELIEILVYNLIYIKTDACGHPFLHYIMISCKVEIIQFEINSRQDKGKF
jgi:hypothetical protein